ncbi:MAG: ribosome-associated translation inhibitor RaiA [Myxococcales bacterium]|nr:ribosome-associated translation inhibitor RaiA [Myxococcales bacterium]
MKCSVTFRHMKPSDAVRQYAEERVDKVTRLIDREVEAQVILSLESHLHVAHIELVTDGSLRIRGLDKSSDMYASIDSAVDRILRQVKRYRSKIRNHRESGANGRELPHRVFSVDELEPETKTPQIVRQETVIARSMTVDDAVMQMDLMDTDFLVFTNAESQQVNVVYRLPDGQYGLIEAHAPRERHRSIRAVRETGRQSLGSLAAKGVSSGRCASRTSWPKNG